MLGLALKFKEYLIGLGAVLAVLLGAYLKGRKDQSERHEKVEQKRYEKTKAGIEKVKRENKSKSREDAQKDIEESLEKLKRIRDRRQ